jgi:uncharacterized repeat protein (TIGR03803 family)
MKTYKPTLLFVVIIAIWLTTFGANAHAQSLTVLHNFSYFETANNSLHPGPANCAWGSRSGLVRDAAGNLYGATCEGGPSGVGTVYKIDSSGNFSVLYSFAGAPQSPNPPPIGDGAYPQASLIMDSAGNLYGTTETGGALGGGTVFELVKASGYGETILFSFLGSGSSAIGGLPLSPVVMDASGNIFGTTFYGGPCCNIGNVFELVNSSGSYSETILHSFSGPDGAHPLTGLLLDSAGNLYGSTYSGGSNAPTQTPAGNVFELTNSGGTYTFNVLYNFETGPADGQSPDALVMDSAGNIYGATAYGGTAGYGTVFELVKASGYSETVLYNFTNSGGDGGSPFEGVIIDSAGNLYGTTYSGGASNSGTIFELVNNNGSYAEKVLYSFTGADGANPWAGLTTDDSGNLYGTTMNGGALGYGTVFQLAAALTPEVNLSPPSLTFGPQQLGTSSTAQTETVTNTGTANLTISTVTIGGANASDFLETDTCTGATLTPNGTCSISVTFAPVGRAGLGAQSGFISIADNATGSPQSISLSGTGIDTLPPALSISARPSTLWPPNGKSVPVTISGTITDGGSGINPSTLACNVVDSYGLDQPACSVGSLGAGGAYSFTVSLVASRNGNDKNGRTYTITVSASDYAGNPTSVSTTVVVPHDQGH